MTAFRKSGAALAALLIVLLLAVPVLAYAPNSSGAVYIPEGAASLSAGAIDRSPSSLRNVRTVYVPSTVTYIAPGTFVGFPNLRSVVIRNDRGKVQVAAGAVSGSVSIVYSGAPERETAAVSEHSQTGGVSRPASFLRTRTWRRGTAVRSTTAVTSTTAVPATAAAQQHVIPPKEDLQPLIPPTEDQGSDLHARPDGDAVNRANPGGSRGMTIFSYVLAGAAVVTAGILCWLKYGKK